MRAATYEMAALDAAEAVVNVTLDFSLAFSVTHKAAPKNVTEGKSWTSSDHVDESIMRMLTVLPEEPLERTIASHCSQYSIGDQTCSQMFLDIEKMVISLWGCENKSEALAVQSSEDSIEFPDAQPIQAQEVLELSQLTLKLSDTEDSNQNLYELTLSATQDLELQVALFCRKHAVDLDKCGLLYQRAEKATRSLPAFQREHQQRELNKALNISSPVSTRLYPTTQRVYIEVGPGPLLRNKSALDESSEDQICFYVDYRDEPALCGPELFKDPKYFNRQILPLGHHVFMFAYHRRRGSPATQIQVRPPIKDSEWIAAVHVDVVQPQLELLGVSLNSTTTEIVGKQVYMSAKLQTWDFDILDTRHRLCVLCSDAFACLKPVSLVIESDSRENVAVNRSMVLHVPILGISSGDHEVTVMLIDEYTNVLAHSSPVTVHVSLSNDVTPLAYNESNLVDLREFVPQRPRKCPAAMKTSKTQLSWICELWRHEWGIYSQNGEDGVLQSIFHHIGVHHREYVEFGTEDGSKCNTRYLREFFNWTGLLMDGSHSNPSINLHREFVTAENINALFAQHGVSREFDLLSIDVDFNDFWILSAIDLSKFAPRVLVVEFNSHIPPPEARAVQYNATRSWDAVTDFFGVSMSALQLWGRSNGYALVYCESHGVNCFLVRNDALGSENEWTADLVGGEELFAPPNFFGKGWSYPNASNAGDKWQWLQ